MFDKPPSDTLYCHRRVLYTSAHPLALLLLHRAGSPKDCWSFTQQHFIPLGIKTDALDCVFLLQSVTLIPTESALAPRCTLSSWTTHLYLFCYRSRPGFIHALFLQADQARLVLQKTNKDKLYHATLTITQGYNSHVCGKLHKKHM